MHVENYSNISNQQILSLKHGVHEVSFIYRSANGLKLAFTCKCIPGTFINDKNAYKCIIVLLFFFQFVCQYATYLIMMRFTSR